MNVTDFTGTHRWVEYNDQHYALLYYYRPTDTILLYSIFAHIHELDIG